MKKSVLLTAILLLLCSCGSRKSVQFPNNVPVQISENGRVTLDPTPVVVSETKTPAATWKDTIQAKLDSLCQNPLFETTQLGLYIYDLTDNLPVYAFNATQRMRPASIQKLITSISGLHYLGGEYNFKTDLRITGNVVNGTLQGDVYVVGGMDPLLSFSDLNTLAAALRKAGISSIAGNLYTDLSMKDDLPYGWGWCWDDDYGPLSALMVDAKDKFNSDWSKALAKAGIKRNKPTIRQQQTPTEAKSVLCITHTIDEVLQPLLKNSQNIYAECLFYQIAAFSGQKQAGRKQAAKLINDLITSLGMEYSQYQIADGSGLSLYNYVSPELLVRLLNYAYGKPEIYEHLYPALPIAGVDGTISKRMQDTPAYDNVHAKTGTLSGISSLAGYLTAHNGHILSFCIINQGVSSGKPGRDFQDSVCVLLCQ
jgi:D-alanyl-D-alanine carboxypeptidase/D-alanyl-D-alanine-endopeptidase (penicillin-binding protein 4)